jgi:Sel1 repeat
LNSGLGALMSYTKRGMASAEGFYWMAERFMWGSEDTPTDPVEALKLYKQAAELGVSDAHIRIGELYEHGRGVAQNAAEALASYQRAAETGNFFADAFIANLFSRTAYAEKAQRFWGRFFGQLRGDPDPNFVAESVGGLIHSYIRAQLRMGTEPDHRDIIRDHWQEIVSYHQKVLEHGHSDEGLDQLEQVGNWLVRQLR